MMCLGASCVGNTRQMYTNGVKQRLFLLGQRRVFSPNFSLLFVDSRPDNLLHERDPSDLSLCPYSRGWYKINKWCQMEEMSLLIIHPEALSFIKDSCFPPIMVCDRSPPKGLSTSLFLSSLPIGSFRGAFKLLVSYPLQRSLFPPTALTYQAL